MTRDRRRIEGDPVEFLLNPTNKIKDNNCATTSTRVIQDHDPYLHSGSIKRRKFKPTF